MSNIFQLVVSPLDSSDFDTQDWAHSALTPNPICSTLDRAKAHALALTNQDRAEQDRDNAEDIANHELIALGQLNALEWEEFPEGNNPLWVAVDADTGASFAIHELPLL